MHRIILNSLFILILPLCGCSTCYVASLRSEFNDSGHCIGLYYGINEYPSVFLSTRVSLCIEIPAWWWPSNTRIGREYQLALWPIGAILSVADLPISVLTDTIMLPYDLWKVYRVEELQGE